MNVVIVAGGLGTRFGELSVFPKILLPCVGYDSILNSHLDYFSGCNITVVINDKFYDMFSEYCSVNHIDNIRIISSHNSNGSYNTIAACYQELPKENVMFVWSDILLSGNGNLVFDENHNVIFTYPGAYRYKSAVDDRGVKIIRKTLDGESGDIPGLYYFRKLPRMYPITTEYDLVDFIVQEQYVYTNVHDSMVYDFVPLNNIVEYRDYDSYVNIYGNSTGDKKKARFFNTISVHGNVLEKKCTDEKYANLIEKEGTWYTTLKKECSTENCKDSEVHVTPDIFSVSSRGILMEYLKDYQPLHEFLKNNSEDVKKIRYAYTRIKDKIDALHYKRKFVPEDVFRKDLHKEVVEKTVARCESIRYMLINYSRKETADLLESVFEEIYSLSNVLTIGAEYSFGHGDLNGSNIMIEPESVNPIFIDPRGYFGNTEMFVWNEYETAKLLYCLSGYDDFNINPKIYKKDTPRPFSDDVVDSVSDILGFSKVHYLLLGVIWMALAGYISQDIMKANIAFEYGFELLKKELN